MKILFLFLIFVLSIPNVNASPKNDIIKKLTNLNNLSFKFEQNINGDIQNGNCTIKYPKKIFCIYESSNNKILVSNGRSLVIKTNSSYYIYPIEKTPLNLILDKNYLLNKIKNLDERIVNDQFINFAFTENDNQINLFFDKKTFNLIGWQTIDIYQNLSITYLSSINRNHELKKNLFKLPKKD